MGACSVKKMANDGQD